MKLSALSTLIPAFLVLSSTVAGASVRRDKGRCRPHGSASSSVVVMSTTDVPVPTTTIPAAPAPTTQKSNPSPSPSPSAPVANPAPAPPKSSPSPAPAPKGSDDQQSYLNDQNTLRAQKGAVAFTWNDTLASYAQQVANTCVFKHSGGPYGENLSAGTHPFSIDAAIKLWTDEESSYDPSNPQPSHYTQVVWKGSNQVGCAVTNCANLQGAFANADYYVCEYYPPGNVIGEFPQNVEA